MSLGETLKGPSSPTIWEAEQGNKDALTLAQGVKHLPVSFNQLLMQVEELAVACMIISAEGDKEIDLCSLPLEILVQISLSWWNIIIFMAEGASSLQPVPQQS